VTAYLFSVDLEDPRDTAINGARHPDRVPHNTERLLTLLQQQRVKTTFFVVGEIARRHPQLIRSIVSDGHEIACHTTSHVPLTQRTPAQLRADLDENIALLKAAGANDICGFRAPIFSLTQATPWVYDVLKDMGFAYSSSVLPAPNPLYGWPEHGTAVREHNGIIEIPVSLLPLLRVPAGGVYFRVLPRWLLQRWFATRFRHGEPVVGYLHPYDIDTADARLTFAGFEKNPVFNQLMYVGRGSVLAKLQAVLALGFDILPYRDWVGDWVRQHGASVKA
jgi:polysaccharide deacetylase family protein (PEP-CTERM system associated)